MEHDMDIKNFIEHLREVRNIKKWIENLKKN